MGTAAHFEWSLWRGTGDNVNGAQVSIDGYNNAGVGGPVQCYVTGSVLQTGPLP